MKYVFFAMLLISGKPGIKPVEIIKKPGNFNSPCLVIETSSGMSVGISNACKICMKGTIRWQTGDTTVFSVPPFGPHGYVFLQAPSAPNSGKIIREWACQ